MCSMASFMVARFQGRCHAHFNWTLFNDGIGIILWFLDFSNKSRLSKFFVCNIVIFSDSRREFIFSTPSFVTPFYKFKTTNRYLWIKCTICLTLKIVRFSFKIVASTIRALVQTLAKHSFDASAIKYVSYPSFAPDKAVSPTQIS